MKVGALAAAENVAPGKKQSSNHRQEYQDYAWFMAGKNDNQSSLAEYEKSPAWLGYAKAMEPIWLKFEQRQLIPMRQWASEELKTLDTSASNVFYPFSGPDFINLYALFPHAKNYLLIALEPVGEIPDFSAIDQGKFLASLKQSLHDVLRLNFFVTAKLRSQLHSKDFKGVLPIIFFGLARQDVQILDVQAWRMDPEGAIKEQSALDRQDGKPREIQGVRILFQNKSQEQPQTLYYFCFNLQNDSFNQNPHFISFLKNFGPLSTFTKAASYLMFNASFSGIRQLILDQSSTVLQTDSGIPLKFFEPATWSLKFYGDYTSPIPLFRNYFQPDKARIYEEDDNIPPLPFDIGYFSQAQPSNLLLAIKKEKR